MLHKVFTIKYVTSKNCFCYLSSKNSGFLNEGVTLKVSYGNNVAYLSPLPSATLNESYIGINYLHCKALNLEENDYVMVTVCDSIPSIRRLVVSPVSQEDYEVLELLAENIESTLLNQIRVVSKNQKFLIWVSDSFHVTVSADSISPVSPGRLDNFSEVEITLPKNAKTNTTNERAKKKNWSLNNILHKVLNSNDSKQKESSNNCSESTLQKYLDQYLLCFSLHPIKDLKKLELQTPGRYFDVFVCRNQLPESSSQVSSSNLCTLKLINHTVTNIYAEQNDNSINSVVVQLHILEEPCNEINSFPALYVSDCILKTFNAKIGAKVLLHGSVQPQPSINCVEIHTTEHFKHTAVEKFKEFLSQNDKLLLNADVVLNTDSEFSFLLKFVPANAKFCFFNSDFVRICTFTVADAELNLTHKEVLQDEKNMYFEDFGNIKQIVNDILDVFKTGLMNSRSKPENVLIVGKPGAGKSTLIKILCGRLLPFPFRIYTEVISCKNIKGKSLESLQRMLSEKILNLIYYQPSVLILDDLHVICEKVNEGDALQQTHLHINRISEMLANVLNLITKTRKIAILATSESVLKLNQYIFSSRGHHLLKHVCTIDELITEHRLSLMKFLFESNSQLDVDLQQFAIRTEGFVVQDLVDFVDKAIFESLKEEYSDKPHVTELHCETSLKNTVSLSLKDVQLHSPGEKDFSDVGGLEDVKKVLVECMMWPVQYPNLFGKAPLRLQSGLLLYGPPGTGKTILAGAAAKHCGLRLISIKGPELLSKYIGASEEAVRSVFERAQSAKPCILFFDEFDSLAPRRGHDSTGVTDRVVNQLLTQLDGVESLSGVCVLAATSRPDLLDPALLRPGRLDRQILCPLPDKASRLKILRSLSKRMKLANDVDLTVIAKGTNGYSGADLQAVLYTAQLSAVDQLLEDSVNKTNDVTEINQGHVEEALKTTRPSLTKEENLKYQRIYSKFQQRNDVVDIKSGVQRATLA